MSKTIRRKNGSVNREIEPEGSIWWRESFYLRKDKCDDYAAYVKDVKRWYHSDLPGKMTGDKWSLPRAVRNFGQERPFRQQAKQMIHRCIVNDRDFSLKRPKRDAWMYF